MKKKLLGLFINYFNIFSSIHLCINLLNNSIHSFISLYISSIQKKTWSSTEVQLRAFEPQSLVYTLGAVCCEVRLLHVKVRVRVCALEVCACVLKVSKVCMLACVCSKGVCMC